VLNVGVTAAPGYFRRLIARLVTGRDRLVDAEARHTTADYQGGVRVRTGRFRDSITPEVTERDEQHTAVVIASRGLPAVRSRVDETGLTEGRLLRGRTTYVDNWFNRGRGRVGLPYFKTDGTHAAARAAAALRQRMIGSRSAWARQIAAGARNAG
jgi:hypothetical protein